MFQQRASVYCRYGPESPDNDVTLSRSKSTSRSRCGTTLANTTAPTPTAWATASSSAGAISGFFSTIFGRTSSTASAITSVSKNRPAAPPPAAPRVDVFLPPNRTSPNGTCWQRLAQSKPSMPRQVNSCLKCRPWPRSTTYSERAKPYSRWRYSAAARSRVAYSVVPSPVLMSSGVLSPGIFTTCAPSLSSSRPLAASSSRISGILSS